MNNDFLKYLFENKSALMKQKKSMIKHADAISAACVPFYQRDGVEKADTIPADVDKIRVKPVINTTYLMDSYDDVHIDGIWDNSLKENNPDYLINSHKFDFENVISDEVKVYVKTLSWKELSLDFKGETQALIYDSVISKDDSPSMFDKYRTGRVKQHSVGMQYVDFDLALGDKRYKDEYERWEKYIDRIANKSLAERKGYFWAIVEAKNIEGSAVLRGANFATPVLSVREAKQETTGSDPDFDKYVERLKAIKKQ